MNDIRILIPFYERMNSDGENWSEYTYNKFLIDFTRPITPEDIRSCLRMPDEWTQKQRNEFMNVVADRLCGAQDVAIKFLDIATRLSTKPDPWEMAWDVIANIIGTKWNSEEAEACSKVFFALKKAEGK